MSARAKAQGLFRGFGDRISTGGPTVKLSLVTCKSGNDERVDNPWELRSVSAQPTRLCELLTPEGEAMPEAVK